MATKRPSCTWFDQVLVRGFRFPATIARRGRSGAAPTGRLRPPATTTTTTTTTTKK